MTYLLQENILFYFENDPVRHAYDLREARGISLPRIVVTPRIINVISDVTSDVISDVRCAAAIKRGRRCAVGGYDLNHCDIAPGNRTLPNAITNA